MYLRADSFMGEFAREVSVTTNAFTTINNTAAFGEAWLCTDTRLTAENLGKPLMGWSHNQVKDE